MPIQHCLAYKLLVQWLWGWQPSLLYSCEGRTGSLLSDCKGQKHIACLVNYKFTLPLHITRSRSSGALACSLLHTHSNT